jgi:transposase
MGGEWCPYMPKPSSSRPRGPESPPVAAKALGESGASIETIPKRPRRTFIASEKRRIVEEADAAVASGERGALEALLRREGIYSSHLTTWRRLFAAGGESGLAPKKPGRKPKLDAKDRELLAQGKRIAELERKLHIANALIGLQKKAHEILGIALPQMDEPT